MFRTRLTLAVPAFAMMAMLVCVASIAQPTQRAATPDSPPTSTPIANGKYYALVIGINTYPAPMPSLKTAENDAKEIAAVLHDLYNFDSANINLLLGPQATRSAIIRALITYRRTLQPEDNLLIYYAGHGYLDKDAGKAFWLPADADEALSPNTISADDITTQIRALPARHVLIISDSCYSGDLTRAAETVPITGGQPNLLNRMLALRSRTMMSSGGDEPVSDSGKDNHSVFANALITAFKSNDTPIATAGDLFYGPGGVQHLVSHNATQVPYYKPIPNSTDADGDFLFMRSGASHPPASSIAASIAPPDPQFTLAFNLYATERFSEALSKFISSCDSQGGSPASCTYAGLMFSSGKGVAADDSKAVPYFRKACDAGDAQGCFGLANSLVYLADTTPVDIAQIMDLYRKSCDGGYLASCINLGVAYMPNSVLQPDPLQAAKLFGKACDGGDSTGCTNLGAMYESGTGVTQDKTQAVALYRKGCDGGDASGCNHLGAMYESGTGVTQDKTRAVALFRKACDGGNASGCTNLGIMYDNGTGVTQDKTQAVALFRKGCDGDNANGCTDLGVMYDIGTGVTKDEVQAVALFRKGCDGGDARGCSNLGVMYENGTGVTQDKTQAVALYRKGCDGGDADGCANLKRLQP